MSKLTLIFYGFALLTVVLFILFSYLMTTVNPERINNSSDGNDTTTPENDVSEKPSRRKVIVYIDDDDDTLDNDERKAAEDVTVEWVDIKRNVVNWDRKIKLLNDARKGGETVKIKKSTLPVPRCSSFQTSRTRSTGAILVDATLESNLTAINGTSSSKSSKGRRSIKEQRKKKQGIVVLRVIGDEGKPRIEVVLYPNRLKGKSRKNHDYIRNQLGKNSILNILPDDTAIFENGDYSYNKDTNQIAESNKMKYAEIVEIPKTTENIFGLKSLGIKPINTSKDSHGDTKLSTYLLPTLPTIIQNSSRELTFDDDNTPIKIHYDEKFKSDIITDEHRPMLPIKSSITTDASSELIIAKNNTEIEINNSKQINSDVIVEQTAQTQSITLLNKFFLPTDNTPTVMNVSREVTPAINMDQSRELKEPDTLLDDQMEQSVMKLNAFVLPTITGMTLREVTPAINMDQSGELKLKSEILLEDQMEQSVTKLNTFVLPTITENTTRELTLAIVNTQNKTDYEELIEIESDKMVEVSLKVKSETLSEDQMEQSVTKLNTFVLPTITENTLGEVTHAIDNTQNKTDYEETIEIESDKMVEVNTQSFLDSITPKSDIVSWSEMDIITDRKSNENATYDSDIELTSTLPTDESVGMSGVFPESNETFASANTPEIF